MFDEIMNEFYTIRMMQIEGYDKSFDYDLKSKTLFDQSSEKVRYHGNGYPKSVQLAELYDKLFGNELLNAKFYNRQEFVKDFNEKYKSLVIDILGSQDIPPFVKIGNQISTDLYGAYETAIDIWKINKKEQVENKGFSFYQYLKDTNDLISFLPQREDTMSYRTDKNDIGIPPEIFSKITQIDSEFIFEYINPGIMKIQDEDMRKREINTLLSVINILRENIQDLSEQDIENLSYGKIKEYTHNGRDCLVINAGNVDFMTFINNSVEHNDQFSAYSKFKKISEFKDLGFTKENEEELRKTLIEKGYNVQEFTYATVFDAGQYGVWSLVKSDGSYYRTSGEISKVQISDVKSLGIPANKFKDTTLDNELRELVSETTNTDFNNMSQNIKTMERINEQFQSLDSERTGY